MATNDGYAPYPLGLTAAEAVTAITRAYNLSTELAGYIKYTSSSTTPDVSTSKDGDIWFNTGNNSIYRAYIGDNSGTAIVIWFETYS